MGLTAGVQATGLMDINVPAGDDSSMAIAAKIGYEMKDTFAVSIAGSQVGENDNGFGAGFNVFGAQSKLYTEAWWNYGYITRPETTAINLTASTSEELTYVGLGLYVTQATSTDFLTVGGNATDAEMMEVTLEASKSFGPLDASLVYIMTDANDQNLKNADADSGESYSTVQAYLTYNF